MSKRQSGALHEDDFGKESVRRSSSRQSTGSKNNSGKNGSVRKRPAARAQDDMAQAAGRRPVFRAHPRKKKKKSQPTFLLAAGAALVLVLLLLLFAAGRLSGRTASDAGDGGEDADLAGAEAAGSDVLVFHKDGSLTVKTEETFSEPYYSEDELREMISRSVAGYNQGSGAVEAGELTVRKGSASLSMEYATAEDYAAFNGVELYYGTVSGANAAGYDLSVLLGRPSVKDSASLLTSERLEGYENYPILVLTEPAVVRTASDILYYTENLTLNGSRKATAGGEGSASSPGMLILK